MQESTYRFPTCWTALGFPAAQLPELSGMGESAPSVQMQKGEWRLCEGRLTNALHLQASMRSGQM